jgi:hypothetical protein
VHENRNAIGDLDHAAASVAVQRIGTAASGIQSSSVKFCIGNNPARFAPAFLIFNGPRANRRSSRSLFSRPLSRLRASRSARSALARGTTRKAEGEEAGEATAKPVHQRASVMDNLYEIIMLLTQSKVNRT